MKMKLMKNKKIFAAKIITEGTYKLYSKLQQISRPGWQELCPFMVMHFVLVFHKCYG